MANNPYINKVIYNGSTLIDTSDVTVTTDTLAQGYTALSASGEKITGARVFVDGVKGEKESNYRTGNVSISAENVGALPKEEYKIFTGGQTVLTNKSGSTIMDDNSVRGKIENFTIYGKSTQQTTTGKNLLPNNATTRTINGITFTINADGSITANGTASSRAVIYLDNTALTMGSGSYILSGTPLVDSGLYIVLYVVGTGGAENWINDKGSGKAFELSDGDSINSVYIQIEAGVTVNAQSFYPQIERGSIATAYEPYTGGIPAPNPDYPMAIETAGEIGDIPVSIEWREIPSESAGVTQNIVGLEVDYVNKTFTRLADAAGKTAGEDFNHIAPYGGRKRCNVADDGTITAWRGDANYREDGSNGQVMVYQPKFWYKRDIITKDASPTLGYNIRKERIYITDKPTNGYKLHPTFIDPNGDEVDYVMFSAYEACIYDTSASTYLMRDEQVMDVNTDKLSSIANAKPASGLTQQLTRSNVEALAQNRGENWHGDLIKLESANQILAIVELGMMNGQTAIESGVSGITDNSAYNCSSLTGSTSALGDATGAATSTTNEINGTTTEYDTAGKRAISYRGVENPFGNIWKFVYGINIHGNGSQGGVPYVCTDFAFAESKNNGNYESAGFALANVNGYISAMGYGNEKFDWLFMPSEVNGNGANSTLPVGDYLYRTENLNGYRIVLLGGYWNDDATCGFFYWNCANGVGVRNRAIGGRLAYVPIKGTAHDSNVERWMKQSGFWKSTIQIPTPNGLPGIPVDSGGNYTDTSGQMWLCDTIDKAAGTYTQRIGQIASYAGETLPGAWMSSMDVYAEGSNPTTGASVLYALSMSITTPLTTTQAAALEALCSHSGVITIYTTDPLQPEMEVKIPKAIQGESGIVPTPDNGNQFLRSDGIWSMPDNEITKDSNNLITSGAVYDLISKLTARIEALENANQG